MITKGPFEGWSTVAQWVRHVDLSAPGTPGCYRAGGGPPPPRSEFLGQGGFWVKPIDYYSHYFYVWVPDEIAARDNTGKYKAGQESP